MTGQFITRHAPLMEMLADDLQKVKEDMKRESLEGVQREWDYLFKGAATPCPDNVRDALKKALELAGLPCVRTPEATILNLFDQMDVVTGLQALCCNGALLGNKIALKLLHDQDYQPRVLGNTYTFFGRLINTGYLAEAQALYIRSIGMEWDCKVHTGDLRGIAIRTRFVPAVANELSNFRRLTEHDFSVIGALSQAIDKKATPFQIDPDTLRAARGLADGMLTRFKEFLKRQTGDIEVDQLAAKMMGLKVDKNGNVLGLVDDTDSMGALVHEMTIVVDIQNFLGTEVWSPDQDALEKVWLTLDDILQPVSASQPNQSADSQPDDDEDD